MANTNTSYIKDPINGITYEKDLHLFDTEKVVHSKDDVKGIKRGLRKLNCKITGKNAFDENGNHKGFSVLQSAGRILQKVITEGTRTGEKNWNTFQRTALMKSGWITKIWTPPTRKSLARPLKNTTGTSTQTAASRIILPM